MKVEDAVGAASGVQKKKKVNKKKRKRGASKPKVKVKKEPKQSSDADAADDEDETAGKRAPPAKRAKTSGAQEQGATEHNVKVMRDL